MSKCKVCPEPGVEYTSNGVKRQRYFCAKHWNEYTANIRQWGRVQQGIPDGWLVCRSPNRMPPEGIERVVIDGYRYRAARYRGNRWRVVHFRGFRVLNHIDKLVSVYERTGWQLVERQERRAVLERRYAS